MGSSCASGRWNNGVRHSNDVLQARANVKNNKYKDVYWIVHKAFAPAIIGMSGQSTLTFFCFSGFLLTNRCGRTTRRIRSELRLFDG